MSQEPDSELEWTRDQDAADDRWEALYPELRAIAAVTMGADRGGTLQPTALVHEVYLKLRRAGRVRLVDEQHFKALAARMMRQVIIDSARRRSAARRAWTVVMELKDAAGDTTPSAEVDVVELDEALSALADADARAARIVECRIFGGMSLDATAAAIGVGRTTVAEDWRFARAWLARELG